MPVRTGGRLAWRAVEQDEHAIAGVAPDGRLRAGVHWRGERVSRMMAEAPAWLPIVAFGPVRTGGRLAW
ncbi:hypothetical protein Fuma_02277 [Fuerstiella marisgermanici]|uniref:Uncharacterized protein n=1 Tax=Fuerstiella marisgermanici TaxID=1891926 RepID=A0A1P8WF30_9PLAN|nr:hypothetical protein Fuma_02277 [Fuerstiella marisgermanici]